MTHTGINRLDQASKLIVFSQSKTLEVNLVLFHKFGGKIIY